MQRRVGGLDGVRGIALVAVLLFHFAPNTFGGGFLGVEMFFMLSGFLLASHLLDESSHGSIDVAAYAARRARRILPAMAVLVVALALVATLAPRFADRLGTEIVASLAGAVNWLLIGQGNDYFAQIGTPSLVRHLWSVAVEAQAYVVLPIAVVFVARRPKHLGTATLVGGIALSSAAMALHAGGGDVLRAYYGTDTRIGAVLAGALLALRLRDARRLPDKRLATVAVAAGAVILLGLVGGIDESSNLLYPGGFLLTQAATAALIIGATAGGRAGRTLSVGPLRWLGIRSYGIYLWHWPVVVIFGPSLITFVASIWLGALSYHYVERPFLRAGPLLRRLSLEGAVGARVGWVTGIGMSLFLVAGLFARPVPGDPLEASILAGEQALAVQPAPTPPPAPRREAEPYRITAIGDSVMIGAVPQLKAAFGDRIHIDAAVSRQAHHGNDVIAALKDEGVLGDVVIVHLGNNGPLTAQYVDEMMHDAKGVKWVLFVTVRVGRPWQDGAKHAVRDAPSRHPGAKVIDWWTNSEGHPEWFYDGSHLTVHGGNAYAKLFEASIPQPPPPPRPSPTPVPDPFNADVIVVQ